MERTAGVFNVGAAAGCGAGDTITTDPPLLRLVGYKRAWSVLVCLVPVRAAAMVAHRVLPTAPHRG